LLIGKVQRPYSWLQPHVQFPLDLEVWDRAGKLLRTVAKLPLADAMSIDGVRTGPRNLSWRPDEPATLAWREALDGGNPREKVLHRDRIVMLRAPFTAEPVELLRTEHRAMEVDWLEKGGLALVRDFDRVRRWQRTFLINTSRPGDAPKLLWSRSVQDRYADPGIPVERATLAGRRAIAANRDQILLRGNGATPQGERPFLDRYNVATGETARLFLSNEAAFETVVAPLDDAGTRLLIRRESSSEPPNYLVRNANGQAKAVTNYTDPTPQLRGIRKQVITYKRADGVALSFTLYLPPGYKEGTRLPTVVWAYPREHTGADTAGQVSGSPYRFTTMNGASHMFFLLAGYAILDDAAMPVIGDHETVNNTYIEQVVMGAKAAIDKAVELGVTDRERVGVGGHSYGGFMTANLLAHSDLFRAGIARSGAYNRTLTPFGFQAERRTLWEAPDTYLKMSPFLHANKIKEPILLIHGEADDNSGTFPIQSERLYMALKGHGATVRYVTLPNEAHGYAARESILHTVAEMLNWSNEFAKNAKPRPTTSQQQQ
jgi:dipeptidyl aminopeptidase/acylaminoacyl peptidase